MLLEVIDLQVQFLVFVSVVAAVRIHGVGIDRKAVVADRREVRDCVRDCAAVSVRVGRTCQRALTAEVFDHVLLVCRIAVEFGKVEVVEEPPFGNHSAVRIDVLFRVVDHVEHAAVVDVRVRERRAVRGGVAALDVVDDRVAADLVADDGRHAVVIALLDAILDAMVVGDLDRLVHRDRTVLADCRKRRIDFHAVQVVRNLCILVDIVAAGGDPRDQHVAVLRFHDGRLEVRRIVHGDRDRVAPDAVLVGRELQRGALIFALRVVAVDERKYDGAVIQGNELRIRTFIRVLRKDLRGARRERVARRVLSADPGGIRSASLTEAEALRRGRLPHARLLIADHLFRVIDIMLEESERLAGKLDHDRNREQE